jgi:hypothetical protein
MRTRMNGLTVQARDSAVNRILAVTTQVVHADLTAKVDWFKDTPSTTHGKGTSVLVPIRGLQ